MISTVNVGARCLAVAALLFASVAPALAEWRRIDSPNFTVVGDVSAGDLREIEPAFEPVYFAIPTPDIRSPVDSCDTSS